MTIFVIFPVQVFASEPQHFVVYNGYKYTLSLDTPNEVGEQIGEITFYTTEQGIFSGNVSNYYGVGTKLFKIVGVEESDGIAVEVEPEKHLIAVQDGKYDTAVTEFEDGNMLFASLFLGVILLLLLWNKRGHILFSKQK